MKIVHRVHLNSQNMTGLVDADYQREVDRSTYRLEREWTAAQKALSAAQGRAERAQHRAESAKTARATNEANAALSVAWSVVEQRRRDLDTLARLLSQSPAGSVHRGDRSYRPVPVRHGSNI